VGAGDRLKAAATARAAASNRRPRILIAITLAEVGVLDGSGREHGGLDDPGPLVGLE